MTLEEIERLAALCASAGIGSIELSEAGFSLRLEIMVESTAAPHRTADDASKAEITDKVVCAPCIGVFRFNHPATGCPVAELGKPVRKGEMVGVLQTGPLLKAVTAPADGVLGAALVEDGAVVGYGAPLYALL